MTSFTRDVKKILSKHGCTRYRQGKGDHEIWQSPHTGIKFPVDNKILSRHTANGIFKQAGIKFKF